MLSLRIVALTALVLQCEICVERMHHLCVSCMCEYNLSLRDLLTATMWCLGPWHWLSPPIAKYSITHAVGCDTSEAKLL